MKYLLAIAGLITAFSLCASVHAADAESDAWSAAMALKQKSLKFEGAGSVDGFLQTASAFESFAKTYPSSARARDALAEAGVAWFAVGRHRQVMHHSPPASVEAFQTALKVFGNLVTEHPSDPAAARAQYMRGSTQLFLGDLESAELEYTLAIDNYAGDGKYFGKALERRAAVRRHLLRHELAVEDMRRYQKEAPTGSEEADVVAKQLEFSALMRKPAPALDVESWIQGEPVDLPSLRGEVVVLYFFASWCTNCEREREFMNDLFQRYSASGLRMIAVTDHSESQSVSSVRAKLATKPLTCVAFMDRGQTLRAYSVTKFPDCVLIDRAGRVRWHDNPGALADWTVEALLLESPRFTGEVTSA